MKSILFLYLQIFLLTGIPFALLKTAFNLISGNGFQRQSALFVASIPAYRSTLIDFGSNLRNMMKMEELLNPNAF